MNLQIGLFLEMFWEDHIVEVSVLILLNVLYYVDHIAFLIQINASESKKCALFNNIFFYNYSTILKMYFLGLIMYFWLDWLILKKFTKYFLSFVIFLYHSIICKISLLLMEFSFAQVFPLFHHTSPLLIKWGMVNDIALTC